MQIMSTDQICAEKMAAQNTRWSGSSPGIAFLPMYVVVVEYHILLGYNARYIRRDLD